jgi:hypothetical protein
MNLKIPKFITGTLSHDEVGEEVKRRIQKDYKGTIADISTLTGSSEGPLSGSNPIYRFLAGMILNDFLKGQNISPHTLSQGEIALRSRDLHYDESPDAFFEDYGLTVFPKEGNNPDLWKSLRDQVGIDFKGSVDIKLPFVVMGVPSKLKIGESHNSSRIDLGELTIVYNHPSLNQPGVHKFSSDDKGLIESGLPCKLREGNRNLYVGDSGVCRLFRDRDLDLYAWDGYLDDSNDTGRVHYAKNLSIGNLSESLKYLDEIASTQKQEIDKRVEGAKKYLRTGNL